MANGANRFAQLILHRGQERHQFTNAVAAKRLHRLAEVSTGNQREMVADLLQRLHQHRHQIAVGQQQKQQADNHRDNNHRFGGDGHAVDALAGGIKLGARRGVEFLGARAKRAAEYRRHFAGMGAVRVRRAFTRQFHLRDHAVIQQLLPVGDHLL